MIILIYNPYYSDHHRWSFFRVQHNSWSNTHPEVYSCYENISKIHRKHQRSIVCFYHVTYAFQRESAVYSCLNVKELLPRNRRNNSQGYYWSFQNNPLDKGSKLNELRRSEDVLDFIWTSYVLSIYAVSKGKPSFIRSIECFFNEKFQILYYLNANYEQAFSEN